MNVKTATTSELVREFAALSVMLSFKIDKMTEYCAVVNELVSRGILTDY